MSIKTCSIIIQGMNKNSLDGIDKLSGVKA